MITTFEAGAVFKIVDESTPVLRELYRGVAKLDKSVTALRLNLEKIGTIKFGTVNAELRSLTDTMVTMRPELSGVARSLGLVDRRLGALSATASTSRGAISGTFNTMSAGTTAALADLRALNAEWRALALSMRAAGASMRLPGTPGAGGGGRRGGGGGSRFHVGGMSARIPGGHAHFHMGNDAAMAALGAVAYGVYEESEVEDIAARAMITGQIRVGRNMRDSDAFKAIRDVISSTSMSTGFSPKAVGEAILTTERQFGGLDFMKRLQVEKTLLPFAAAEARLKETSLPEAFQSLVGLVHMTGTYDTAKLPALARSFAYTSMITPTQLPRFERALSYSLPMLHAGMGMDPSAVMFLTAMTQTAGITNTKSGTWLRQFFARLMPDTRGTHAALEHNRLERVHGLLNANDQPTWFVKNAVGKVDWMASLSVLSHTMSTQLAKIPDTERLGVMNQIFGAQGGGQAALMNLPQFVDQLSVLADRMKSFQGGDTVLDQLTVGSPVQQARNAFADLQNVLMDIGQVALPPLTAGLRTFDGGLKAITNYFPTTKAGPNDSFMGGLNKAFGRGMAEGGILGTIGGGIVGGVAGDGVGALPGAWAGAKIGTVAGGAYEGGKYIWRYLTAPKTEVSIQPGKVAINLDGRQMAEAVIPFIAKAGAGPAQGAPHHDSTYSTSPVDFAVPY